MDEFEGMESESYLCKQEDATGHTFEAIPISKIQFTRSNCDCDRVLRSMLFCVTCGKVQFVDDPEAPVL